MTRTIRMLAPLAACAAAALIGAGCGDDDFENKPRPPVAEELTGVIQGKRMTVAPTRVDHPGPIQIIISNQTDNAHTVTLEGETVRERVGPINPLDTATLQKTLQPGSYEVRAGTAEAVTDEIRPAELVIGSKRTDSNDELLLP